jgi:arsenite oxidase small subunit
MTIEPRIAAAVNGANGEAEKAGTRTCLMNRRAFLLTGGIATTVVMIGIPGLAEAETPAVVASYPRKFITKLSSLKVDEPFDFEYPDEGEYAESILVKLGREAGGGLGPDKDVVAFNYACTHQGGPLQGTYQAADKALGPCPLHLTTFDLTRHGIFISGQAYQSLPQVLMELEGDDIYAVGMFGLIYGRFDNLQG